MGGVMMIGVLLVGLGPGQPIGGTLGTAVIFSVLFVRIPPAIEATFGRSNVQTNIASAVADPTVVADPNNAEILDLLSQGAVAVFWGTP